MKVNSVIQLFLLHLGLAPNTKEENPNAVLRSKSSCVLNVFNERKIDSPSKKLVANTYEKGSCVLGAGDRMELKER